MNNFHENKKRSTMTQQGYTLCDDCNQFSFMSKVGICVSCGSGTEGDMINRPKHYTTDGIECIDYMQQVLSAEQFIGYLRGNAIKYQHRLLYKGKPAEDAEKAAVYANWLAKAMRGEEIK